MIACFRDEAHRPRATIGDNDIDRNVYEFYCQPSQGAVVELCKSKFEDNIATLDIATIAQPLTESLEDRSSVTFRRTENPDTRYPARSLRTHRKRPRDRRAAEHRDELASPHPLVLRTRVDHTMLANGKRTSRRRKTRLLMSESGQKRKGSR